MQWLNTITGNWQRRIEAAREAKAAQFDDRVRPILRAMSITDETLISSTGDQVELFKPKSDTIRVNKLQEFVDLYLPFVLVRTPRRRVGVRRPILEPELRMPGYDTAKSIINTSATQLLEWWLQYIAEEYELVSQARLAITEALIKGRGVLWHRIHTAYDGITPLGDTYIRNVFFMPVAEYQAVDDIVIDPAATDLRDAGFIARRREMPIETAVEEYNVPEDLLRKASVSKRDDIPDELCRVWEIYSRIGFGPVRESDVTEPEWQYAMEALGPEIFLVVAEGQQYPLNLHPEVVVSADDIVNRSRWPVRTYGDWTNPWPATFLDFYPVPGVPWPRPPLEAGVGYQEKIDELYSDVISQAIRATRNVTITQQGLDQNLLDVIRDDTRRNEVVPVNFTDFDLSKLYHTLTFPGPRPELWQIIQLAESQFAKAVGLDEILYGAPTPTQIRSATEASLRYRQASNRAQMMADIVEDWMRRVAAKDGMLSRLYVPWQQIERMLNKDLWEHAVYVTGGNPGPVGVHGKLWKEEIQTDNEVIAAKTYWYYIESGSGRRRDKAQQAEAVQMIAQTVLPVVLQAAMKTGDMKAFNRYIARLSAAMDIDAELFMIEPEVIPNGQEMDTTGNQAPGLPNG